MGNRTHNMKRKRHKWSFNLSNVKKRDSNSGGGIASCLKCGCVKEYVAGRVTYLLNDTIYFTAPKCDESNFSKNHITT